MGINSSTASILCDLVNKHHIAGDLLTLGRQDVLLTEDQLQQIQATFQHSAGDREIAGQLAPIPSREQHPAMTDTRFFERLGFRTVESVDASQFEQSTYTCDMNHRSLLNIIGKQFDLVFEAGTAEHVFHVPNYFANLADITKVGGIIIQFLPVNNQVDHGFYQFCPTLLQSFYEANHFHVLDTIMIFAEDPHASRCTWRPYSPGEYDTMDKSEVGLSYVSVAIVAQKTEHSTSDTIPQQRIYQNDLNWLIGKNTAHIASLPTQLHMKAGFLHCSGHCWMATVQSEPGLRAFEDECDTPKTPKSSRLVLTENGAVIGPAHALHQDIMELGEGRYSHWSGTLFFSTSDNSNPNTNGRQYALKRLTTDIIHQQDRNQEIRQ